MAVPSSPTHCEIHDYRLNIVYNFTKLDQKEDIIIEHDNEMIRMQLCSPLIKKCNNKDGYAICLIRNNTEKGIGNAVQFKQHFIYQGAMTKELILLVHTGKLDILPKPETEYRNGIIKFIFTGDSCAPRTNYTVTIIMHCDYDAENNSYPELFSHVNSFSFRYIELGDIYNKNTLNLLQADQECNLYIAWRTALACVPRIQSNCIISNAGRYYDLSILTRTSENYVIPMKNETKSSKIILNVCQNIIHHGTNCPIKSGACFDNLEESNR